MSYTRLFTAPTATVEFKGDDLLQGIKIRIESIDHETAADYADEISAKVGQLRTGQQPAPFTFTNEFKAEIVEDHVFSHGVFRNASHLMQALGSIIDEESRLAEKNLDGYHVDREKSNKPLRNNRSLAPMNLMAP